MPRLKDVARNDALTRDGSTSPATEGERPSALVRRPLHPGSVALLAVPIIALAGLGWRRRWMSDDGFINVRVVENLFAGHGPVFNVGERVEVATSTLWLGVLSVGHLLTPFAEISHVAVYGGLLATVLGLIFVTAGSARLWRVLGRQGPLLPLGTIVIAALPPFWDFATSGLETGLTFLWLGLSFLLLTMRLAASREEGHHTSAWRPVWPALVIGLGPLVRPDLALIAAVLGLALLAQSRRSVKSWGGAACAALAIPVGYEVFRAGYYATLVPNTALAKGAGSSLWDSGLRYLDDYAGRYVLVLPLLVIVLAIWAPMLAARRELCMGASALLLSPVVGGALHALFVIRVGGDFMHGRFLLPATFCVLMPFAAVALGCTLRERLQVLVPLLVVVPWAVVVAIGVRHDFNPAGKLGIADERAYYTTSSGQQNPVDLEDYSGDDVAFDWYRQGMAARQRAEGGERLFVNGRRTYPVADGYGIVGRMGNVGIYGVAAGPDVFVDDRLSLANPIGSRLQIPLRPESRIGHSQKVPLVWDLARYALPSNSDRQDVQDAREALRCGDLAVLNEAITAPMTLERFLRNLRSAPALTRLTIPVVPAEARAAFCGVP